MHLLPAYFTSTKYDRKQPKSTALKAGKFEHARWVAKMTGGKKADRELLAKQWRSQYAEDMSTDRSDYVSAGMSSGTAAKAEPKTYTGGNLKGIATMHKSNMVPVFNTQDAEDISRMRRG